MLQSKLSRHTLAFGIIVIASLLLYPVAEGGKTPLLRPEEFHALGYDVVAYGCSSVFTAAHAVLECFKEIRRTGGSEHAASRMIAFDEFNELLGLPEIRKREEKYAKDAEELSGESSGD